MAKYNKDIIQRRRKAFIYGDDEIRKLLERKPFESVNAFNIRTANLLRSKKARKRLQNQKF